MDREVKRLKQSRIPLSKFDGTLGQALSLHGNVKINSERRIKAMGLEVGSIRSIQGIGYDVLGVSWSRDHIDIFQNIHILYLEYGVLSSSGYGVLSFIPLWYLVSAGTDTPYLP
ncbi:hypothetical protein Tco_0793940 [Tanacetum coccineum]